VDSAIWSILTEAVSRGPLALADIIVVTTSTFFIDRIAGEIIRLVASVCVSVRLSVGDLLFEPFDLIFGMRVDLDLG